MLSERWRDEVSFSKRYDDSLLSWRVQKMFVILSRDKTFSSLFNQYFNWSIFRTWWKVLAFSDSSSKISIKVIDARRLFLINRLDDFNSIDSIDCLFWKTIFSWIMILFSAESYAEYASRINALWLDLMFFDWFKITSFCRWSTKYSTNNKNENFISFLNSKDDEVNIMLWSTIR
jgi:hypothetical protein